MASPLLDSELQYFLKIARTKTLLAAANNLGLSQPALSRAMDRLEEKLGFKVFERSRQGVELTEQGEKLLVGIKDLGDDLVNLVDNIKSQSSEVSGEIRISGHQSVLEDYWLPIYPILAKQFPKIRFHLDSRSSRQVVEDILAGKADIGLVINPLEYSNLMIRPLQTTKALFYSKTAAVEHYFLNPQMIDLNKFLRVIKKDFLNESHIQFIDDYSLIANLVKSGMGCGLLPDHVGERFKLSVNQQISDKFRMTYNLKLVMNTGSISEKKRQVARLMEAQLKKDH